jgi:hypothetical protein
MLLSKKLPRGRRYSTQLKYFALSLFSSGPKAYKFLPNVFCLPSKTSLCLWLQGFPATPGFNDEIFEAFASRVQTMSDRDCVCVLLIDEMSFKSYLNYDIKNDIVVGYEDLGWDSPRNSLLVTSALVFMVRGI